MLGRKFFLLIGLLVALAGGIAGAPVNNALAQTGENFILVNYIGRELVLDLDDTTYLVPGTDTAPDGGRFTLNLAPGEHKYAVNVPGQGGASGEFTLAPGEIVARAVIIEPSGPVVSPAGILLLKPRDKVRLVEFDPFAPAAVETPAVDTWQPAAAAPGTGSIVWVNHGGADELTVDVEGRLYKVPPKTGNIPGRLQIDLPPGAYRYTASVPNGSLNGEFTVTAGQVLALEITPVRKAPTYEVGEEFEFLPPATLHLQPADITGQAGAAGQAEQAPPTLPDTGGIIMPAPVDVSAIPAGLVVKNFAGDTLTFTINNQAYTIADRAEATLPLPPGEYTYTASLPFVAATGSVEWAAGQRVELSIAINLTHDVLSVYKN